MYYQTDMLSIFHQIVATKTLLQLCIALANTFLN